jgi:hypothetical protein
MILARSCTVTRGNAQLPESQGVVSFLAAACECLLACAALESAPNLHRIAPLSAPPPIRPGRLLWCNRRRWDAGNSATRAPTTTRLHAGGVAKPCRSRRTSAAPPQGRHRPAFPPPTHLLFTTHKRWPLDRKRCRRLFPDSSKPSMPAGRHQTAPRLQTYQNCG